MGRHFHCTSYFSPYAIKNLTTDPSSFGAGVRVEMDCSQMQPAITVTMEPSLQPEMFSREAVTHKVSVGYQCSGGIEKNITTTVSYFKANMHVTVHVVRIRLPRLGSVNILELSFWNLKICRAIIFTERNCYKEASSFIQVSNN